MTNILKSQLHIGLCSTLLLRFCKQATKPFSRGVFSKNAAWPTEYQQNVQADLEKYWIDKVIKERQYQQGQEKWDKYYVLSMFPYPSGNLHMGHVRVYTISDVMARYYHFKGKRVIHPMGWDAFGLPAENAAIDHGEVPASWTQRNIETMRKQLNALGCSFDWSREVTTCDASYYKWTQYLFLKLFEHGLVYQDYGAVNWDPVDQTVLANEQIDENGRSWRSGAVAEKRHMKQWYIRTTAYSKALYDGLSDLDPAHWSEIVSIQKEWIGQCDGVRLYLPMVLDDSPLQDINIQVFTTTPQCVYGASHLLVSPEHFLNDYKYYDNGSKSDEVIPLRCTVRSPFTRERLPVFVHKSWPFDSHTDSHLAMPSACPRDAQFAGDHELPYRQVIDQSDHMINSESLNGLPQAEAFRKAADLARGIGAGGHVTSSRARDWLISRQRYWGTPIPVVHCPRYGPVAVGYGDLPVRLPEVTEISGRGQSALSKIDQWHQVKCARCDCETYGYRETNTMDTFVDSAWYFLRYLDAHNLQKPFDAVTAAMGMPVDLYIGGKEHATLHLMYARFFSHFLYDLGLVPTREPFLRLLPQGRVMGQSYRLESGRYVPLSEVTIVDHKPVHKESGATLLTEWEKMSKSKYNGVDPQEVLRTFGTDATRLAILSAVAPKSDRPWSEDVFIGVQNWQKRVWNLVSRLIHLQITGSHLNVIGLTDNVRTVNTTAEVFDIHNETISRVTYYMETSFVINTALAWMQNFTNVLFKSSKDIVSSREYEHAVTDLTIMMAPFAPMFACELWSGLSHVTQLKEEYDWSQTVLEQKWPAVSPHYRIPLIVKLQSKTMYKVPIPLPLNDAHKFTKDQALQVASRAPEYQLLLKDNVLKDLHFELTPGVSAVLDFKVNKPKKKPQSKTS